MSEEPINIPADDRPLYARIVVEKGNCVEAWSREHVFLEPGKNELRKCFREKLQNALQSLGTLKKEPLVLNAIYGIKGTPRSDVENLLFYNINVGNFAASARSGIGFKRHPWPGAPHDFPEALHFYKYWLTPPEPPHLPTASATPPDAVTPFNLHAVFEHPSCLTKWKSVWYAIKSDKRQPAHTTGMDQLDAFGVRAVLRCPDRGTEINLAGIIKPVFDGVIASLHRQKESQVPGRDQKIIERFLSGLPENCLEDITKETVCKHLFSDSGKAILSGPLVKLHGKSLACCSADHLCAEGSLTLEQGTLDKWELEAEVYRIDHDKQNCFRW